MCREGFQTGFLARVIREACLRVQGNLETAVEFLLRLRRPGLSLVDHWLRPQPAKMAPFITGPDSCEWVVGITGQSLPALRAWGVCGLC